MIAPRLLTTIELRYVLILHLCQHGESTTAELVQMLDYWGFTTTVRPSKAIADGLRTDISLGRVYRRGRGRYVAWDIPRGTDHRIRNRVLALREQTRPFRELRRSARTAAI